MINLTGEVGEGVRRMRGDVEVIVSVNDVVSDAARNRQQQRSKTMMMMWSSEELTTRAERGQLLHAPVF